MIILAKIVFILIIIRAILLFIDLHSTKNLTDLKIYLDKKINLLQIKYNKISESCHGDDKMFRTCMIICEVLVLIFICVMAFVGGAL